MPSSQPALPADRAFVVQFRPSASEGSPTSDGRVEHLASGEAARFHSLEELLAFMVRVLTNVPLAIGLTIPAPLLFQVIEVLHYGVSAD